MTLEAMNNLVRIGKLKVEPPDQDEFAGLLHSASQRLRDAGIAALSEESRFHLAYGAAHALALAAMRWHGYRSENRYLVFQCLEHTVGLPKAKWRVLDLCHSRRNTAEYEGILDIDAQLLGELIQITEDLGCMVSDMGPVP